MKGYEARIVREAARGRWTEIVPSLAPELAEAVARAPRHGPCPKHMSRDALRLFADFEESGGGVCNTCGSFRDGFALLQWCNNWSFPECLEAVGGFLGVTDVASEVFNKQPHGYVNDNQGRMHLDSIWRDTIPDDGRISAYLTSRGLSGVVPPSLRLHPALEYWTPDQKLLGVFPCMCAPVQNASGVMVTIHRTYLSSEGVGKVDLGEYPAKKLVRSLYPGASMGASIRLSPIASRMAIAEGIETALAVQENCNIHALSTVSANGMEAFQPPPGLRTIDIYADNDISGTGQMVSAKLKRRLMGEGYIIYVHMPREMGTDWLDELAKSSV